MKTEENENVIPTPPAGEPGSVVVETPEEKKKREKSENDAAKAAAKKDWRSNGQLNVAVLGDDDEFFKIHTNGNVHTLSFVAGASGSNQTEETFIGQDTNLEKLKKLASNYDRKK